LPEAFPSWFDRCGVVAWILPVALQPEARQEICSSSDAWMPTLPFKLNQDRCHYFPKQKHKLMNWRAYDASLRQRGSLTV